MSHRVGVVSLVLWAIWLICPTFVPAEDSRHVVVVCIDGLAANLLDDPKAPLPTIRRLAREGSVAEQGMKVSNPSVTWPNHTTLLTGVRPEKHGVLANGVLVRGAIDVPVFVDPRRDQRDLVRVPMLIDAAHEAGLTTAEVNWPCTRGSKSLDDSFPDVPDAVTHMTPRLRKELVAKGILADETQASFAANSVVGRDSIWTETACHIIRERKPHLLLVHLLNVDSTHHMLGPQTPAGYTANAYADACLSRIVAAVEEAGLRERTTLIVLADHGFTTTPKAVRPNVLLRQEKLLSATAGKIQDARVHVIPEGGIGLVYCTNPGEAEEDRKRVKKLFTGREGVEDVLLPEQFAEYGLPQPREYTQAPDAVLVVKDGYAVAAGAAGEEFVVSNTEGKTSLGSHGFVSTLKKMNAPLVLSGRGIRRGEKLQDVENIDVAPTIAKLLGLDFTTDGALLSKAIIARSPFTDDHLRELQTAASRQNLAAWGHWGPNGAKYSSWTSHSNRLIPLYTFGINLSPVSGARSVYRDSDRLKEVFGFVPEETVNPEAAYFDQTDVYRLQKLAVAEGKKCIVLVVFDGMDWQTTRAAAIKNSKKIGYGEGRGSGLHFQDYRGAKTDFGFFVTSPHNDGTKVNVDLQTITNPGGNVRGGYDWRSAGATPWEPISDAAYPIGKGRIKHAYTDSSSSATSLTCGIKTYNAAMNVDALGRQAVPIARTLQKDGFAVGVVTSVPISHATPGCAYANNVHRDDYQDLTRDLLGLPSISHPKQALEGVDVLIGAGWGEAKTKDVPQGENFVAGNRYLADADRKAIDAKMGGRYHVVERTAGTNGKDALVAAARDAIANKQRLFGYFGAAGGHLPFQTADGGFDPSLNIGKENEPGKAEEYSLADLHENPRLADMAVTALDVLASRSDRIWLMLEAGDVDWANHQNNIDNSIGAVLSGDDAFLAVVQWIEKNVGWDKAAVLLTADHGHYLVLDKPEALLGAVGN